MPSTKNAPQTFLATRPAPDMVRIHALTLYPYVLPLKKAWVAANATLTERLGTALALQTDDGLIGWGDCAPLPSTGETGHRKTQRALQSLVPQLVGQSLKQIDTYLSLDLPPEVRWALETALLDNQSQRAGQTLSRWVMGSKPLEKIPVNAALGTGSLAAAKAAHMAGYQIAKIKVGVAPIAQEIAHLHTLTAATSGTLRFRLDANCAWDFATARQFLAAITSLPIDGVEEPLRHPSLSQLNALQSELPYPLAVDESLFQLGPEALFSNPPVRRLVLKPARIGGFERTRHLALKATQAGLETVITSVVDSSIGLHATAHLAATLPPATHGLATSRWLAHDIAPPPKIEAGLIDLPSRPGLGVEGLKEGVFPPF